MIRGLNVILLITSIFALIGVYGIKFRTETIEEEKLSLVRAVQGQEGQLSVLRADWAHFSQPSFIAPLVERHSEVLNLQTLEAKQFGSIADLPMRPEQLNDEGLTALLEALDAGIDPIGDKLTEILSQ